MNRFDERMAAEAEKVYAHIEAVGGNRPIDVDAELLQARLDASTDEQQDGAN